MAVCRSCEAELDADALACTSCRSLIHEQQLTALREEALALERSGQFTSARQVWIRALRLLPHNTRQAAWVAARIGELDGLKDTQAADVQPAKKWVGALGPLAAVVAVLFKSKGLIGLLNAKTLISLGAFIWFYGQQFGLAFGAGFAALILIHELGHWVDIRQRGLPADMPVFLPGLGAYVRWRALGVPGVVRAEISLAGPLAGLIGALACAGLWLTTGAPIWAALARASAWLNVLNLIPVWVLDGGQAVAMLDRSQRIVLLAVTVVLWLLLGESVLLLVAAGAAWCVVSGKPAPQPSHRILSYFLFVLAALALTMFCMPGTGAGAP